MRDADREDAIIIRKRHRVEDDEYHGGVWKLAFADFMTAMMAFFLVMWLVNSTTKENKAAIVQYFNPVQLIDSNPVHKGLKDPKDVSLGNSPKKTDSEDAPPHLKLSSLELHAQLVERELHETPLKALDGIAREDTSDLKASSSDGAKWPRARMFNDPFDRREIAVEGERPESAASNERGAAARDGELDQKRNADAPLAQPDSDTTRQSSGFNLASGAVMSEALRDIVRQEIKGHGAPHVDAVRINEGLLISLTDDANFSMFGIGSIEPRPQLVRILERIGRLLVSQVGEIEVRGHTDGRSYKSFAYDNWRLSTDRANIAQYMLLRGGLAPERIAKVSGFADRSLKNPKDPLAAINRRIEILIRGR